MRTRATSDWQRLVRRRRPLTPRQRNAVRLYASGTVATKRQAALLAGLNPGSFYALTAPATGDQQVKNLHTSIDAMVENEALSTRRLIDLLSRQGVGKIANLMKGSADESIQLKAAIDLADRGSDTSKIQKHQVESWSIRGDDAKLLAEAMVEAAAARQQFDPLMSGDYIRLEGSNESKRHAGKEAGDRQDAKLLPAQAQVEVLEGSAQVSGEP